MQLLKNTSMNTKCYQKGLGIEKVCPNCNSKFILPSENSYKLNYQGKLYHFCSYTCYFNFKKQHNFKDGTKSMNRKEMLKNGLASYEELYDENLEENEEEE